MHTVFKKSYDVVVLGAGYIGLGALERLLESGKRVLLIEPSGQLLWESTASLRNETLMGSEAVSWTNWLERLRSVMGINNRALDPIVAEIQTANFLNEQRRLGRCDTLFYAYPVKLEIEDAMIASMIVATKSGLHRVHARQWVDASEQGSIPRLLDCEYQHRRKATQLLWRCALHSNKWDELEHRLSQFAQTHGMHWHESAKPHERHLSWEENSLPWQNTMVQKLKILRSEFDDRSNCLISQCGIRPYPIYKCSDRPNDFSTLPSNLISLSPTCVEADLQDIGTRYDWGYSAVDLSSERPDTTRLKPDFDTPISASSLQYDLELSCDVLVAGTGTAGSLAAVTSARHAAKTIAVDLAPFPGGVGTGGGITGYFYGVGGAELQEIDSLTDQMTALLVGRSDEKDSWHHDAKKFAIMQLFNEAGIAFHGQGLIFGVEASEGTVQAVLVAFENQVVKIKAHTYIDSTGDGDLCAYAGAKFRTGRQGDERNLAFSQAALAIDLKNDPPRLKAINYDAGWLDPNNPDDLSRSRLIGIEQYAQSRHLNNGELVMIAPLLGIRQSRQIQTDYVLQLDDLVMQRQFEDCIGEASCHADSHSVDFEFEDDEMVFYYWVCRLFRHPLHTELPYRMLLPKGLSNVWIACRAAGMSTNAFYAIRMQRDMQHLGAVAGVAAASVAMESSQSSRSFNCQPLLQSSRNGDEHSSSRMSSDLTVEECMLTIDRGRSGTALWQIYKNPERYRQQVLKTLEVDCENASFYAACALAMWSDERAIPRLIHAITTKEIGNVDISDNLGAYGQEIDIPFWMIAIIMIRVCGDEACLPALHEVAQNPSASLNVRTSIALTIERLVQRSKIDVQSAMRTLNALFSSPIPDCEQMPSRSIARALRSEKQITLPNDIGVDTRQDHSWQLHLIMSRVRKQAGLHPTPQALKYLDDPRAHVRDPFLAQA